MATVKKEFSKPTYYTLVADGFTLKGKPVALRGEDFGRFRLGADGNAYVADFVHPDYIKKQAERLAKRKARANEKIEKAKARTEKRLKRIEANAVKKAIRVQKKEERKAKLQAKIQKLDSETKELVST